MSFGIYLHIPFCARRCDYCDFYSIVEQGQELHERYLKAAQQEFKLRFTESEWPGPISTVYIGGGTPSLLRAEQYAGFLETLSDNCSFAADIEITVEANPESVTEDWLQTMRQLGVNRLSLGIQSLHDPLLQQLGRLHDADRAREAVIKARQCGFDNISLDFIFGIPQQSESDLERDLDELLHLHPEHVAWYCLTWEQGTPLYKRLIVNPDLKISDDDEAFRFMQVHKRMTAAGYQHYEVSSYCLPGYKSRHNSGYWERRPCLAVGASASSFDGVSRWTNIADLNLWLESLEQGRLPESSIETVTSEELLLETLYLGLRRLEGITFSEIQQTLGYMTLIRLLKTVESSRFRDYIDADADRIKLTLPGILLLDEIIIELSDCHE